MKIAFYCTRYASEDLSQLPLGIAYLGSYLEQQGLVRRSDICYANSHAEVLAFSPDVLCVSSTSQVITDAFALAEKVHGAYPTAKCILGGYHITALPRQLRAPFDVGVLGEGELTLAELIRGLQANQWNDEWLRSIEGICFRDVTGSLVTTPRRQQITRLDTLPLPHRHFGDKAPEVYMFTSRGCPYRCIYCASAVHWDTCRYHSPARVVQEIETLHARHGARRIYLLDDLFAANKKRLRAIADLLDERGLLGKLSFHGFVRANLMDEEVAQLLARLKFNYVRFGAESASQRILTKLKKGSVLVAQAQATVDLCRKYDLPVGAAFVFGTPGETERDLSDTFDFLARNRGKLNLSGFYLLTPYPGTELWLWAHERGIVSESMDWSRLALDFTKPEFDWDRAIYLNDETLPLARFKEIVERFRDAFLLGKDRGEAYAKDRPELTPPPPVTAADGLRVELGCGPSPTPGYVHCDARKLPHIEHVCNAWDLPFEPGTVGEIRSRHMLEHLSIQQVRAALYCWNVVLKPAGRLDLCLPDLEYHLKQLQDPGLSPYLDGSNYVHGMAGLYGWQEYAQDFHLWGHSFDRLAALLSEYGFGEIERQPDRRGMACNIQLAAVKKISLCPIAKEAPATERHPAWRRRLAWNDAVLRLARFFTVPEPAGVRSAPLIIRPDDEEATSILFRTAAKLRGTARQTWWNLHAAWKRPWRPQPAAVEEECLERQMISTTQDSEPGHLARYELALRYVAPGARVLDAACGCGYGSALLSDKAKRVVGVDCSAEAVDWARQHFARDGATYIHGDLENPNWLQQCADRDFDVAVSLETLEHFKDPQKYLEYIHRALRPGGLLVVSTPNPETEPLYVNGRSTNPFHFKHWAVDELEKLLKEMQFEPLTWFGQSGTSFTERGDLSHAGYTLFVAAKPDISCAEN